MSQYIDFHFNDKEIEVFQFISENNNKKKYCLNNTIIIKHNNSQYEKLVLPNIKETFHY